MSLEKIQPVSPAAGYIGGKRNLATRLVDIIGRVDHDSYAEPFVGMGGIFLRRRVRPRADAINDISGDVATFFRVLQEHYPYFIDMLRWRVASRADFDQLVGQLACIRGRFLLSINATDGARATFDRFHVTDVPTTYTIGGSQPTAVTELIVSNFPLP